MSGHNVHYEMAFTESVVADPGAGGSIPVDRQVVVCNMKSAAAEARTLPTPGRSGILITLVMDTDGGDITVTPAGSETFYSSAGSVATLVFNDAQDFAVIQSATVAGAACWLILQSKGITVS